MKFPATIVALLLATPALAQAPAAPSPEAVAAATALVDVLTPFETAKANLDAQLAAMRRGDALRAAFANNPQFRMEAAKNQPKFNNALARAGAMQADAMGPVLQDMLPAARTATIDAYARAFTPAEMAAISAFYRTPAGAKLLKTQGPLLQQVNQAIQQRFAPRLRTAQQTVGPKVQAELQALFPLPGAKK
ncbi:DUF2059 domain-containing protein [Sandaracinobacteroides saxicola]|uniref:DUF2059 domain-containing protein n=1 Tax=Sandaracinobacteroides saxicola TaxID=2759707 RepID=A0A7G5IFV3_9SPHN|nr:DUF2059 domain-containing protein [Sandaracinobacteroides saxicola]QMW22245.1 DUF2059 domain-containing protein [Sandaracinobacteroides saxicola]